MGNLPRQDRGASPVRGLAVVPAGRACAAVVIALAWLLAACGGRPASPSTQSASPSGGAPAPGASSGAAGQPATAPAPGTAGETTGTSPAAEPGAPAGPVTEAECQALLAHVVAVANRAHAQTVTPETAPTDAQLADIRARMAPEFLPMCMSLDRATLACQMRARTRDELLACM